jgi:putative transposase
MDGTITKAPLGGRGTGPNPTDRSKSGTKRSILVEGREWNTSRGRRRWRQSARHEAGRANPLENIVVDRPKPTKKHPQNMCMDKAFDFPEVDELVADWGDTQHTSRGEESTSQRERGSQATGRGGGWVVERTNSWMNRFRRLLIRWEKKKKNYLAMIHFACAWITYQQAGIFG